MAATERESLAACVGDELHAVLVEAAAAAAAAAAATEGGAAGMGDETARRSAACKLFFVQNMRDTHEYRQQRLARQQDVLHRAKVCGIDPARALARLRGAESAYLRQRRTKTTVRDFAILTLLGSGGYGQVFLAKERRSGRYVALKRMLKASYTMKNAAASQATRCSEALRPSCTAAAAAEADPTAERRLLFFVCLLGAHWCVAVSGCMCVLWL